MLRQNELHVLKLNIYTSLMCTVQLGKKSKKQAVLIKQTHNNKDEA